MWEGESVPPRFMGCHKLHHGYICAAESSAGSTGLICAASEVEKIGKSRGERRGLAMGPTTAFILLRPKREGLKAFGVLALQVGQGQRSWTCLVSFFPRGHGTLAKGSLELFSSK